MITYIKKRRFTLKLTVACKKQIPLKKKKGINLWKFRLKTAKKAWRNEENLAWNEPCLLKISSHRIFLEIGRKTQLFLATIFHLVISSYVSNGKPYCYRFISFLVLILFMYSVFNGRPYCYGCSFHYYYIWVFFLLCFLKNASADFHKTFRSFSQQNLSENFEPFFGRHFHNFSQKISKIKLSNFQRL